MSILIKGMEMPASCGECELCVSYKCVLTGEIRWSDEFDYDSKRFENCPLVPVPPHGALIDRDDFFATCPELVDGYKIITNGLVVIPAEEGET